MTAPIDSALRNRLLALRAHYRQANQPQLVAALTRQLDRPEAQQIHPEVPGPMLAHCAAWHAIEALPWRCPRCGEWVAQTTPEEAPCP